MWGAIVIGSGPGGLTTAAYLATNGVRTLVLEQYDTIGGCTQVFRRKRKFEFDVGVHYLGDCGPGGPIPTVLRGVGLEGRVEFNQLDPDCFTKIVFPDLEFRVPAGWDEYRRRLIETFPGEERGLRLCLGVLERVGRRVNAELARSNAWRLTTLPVRAPLIAAACVTPLARLFDLCRLSERARAVICAESGDYAAPPSVTPVAAHAWFLNHFVGGGAWYPKGGGQVLAANLLDVIQSHGGTVRTQARVERILVEDGRAVGVKLATGETLHAPVVVSNADVKRTYLDLVGRERLRKSTVRQTERYRMALPMATLYLGLDIDVSERMPAPQYWAHRDADIEGHYRNAYEGRFDPDLPIYLTSATVKDPGNPHAAPPGCSALEVLAVVPPHHEFWRVGGDPAGGEKYSRNPEYRAMKDELTELMIDRAAELMPGLKEHIVWCEASTPITQQRYTLSSGGACYGLEVATDQIGTVRPGPRISIAGIALTGAGRPGPKTEIPGLYLTGAAGPWHHGVFGTLMGGVGTASAILGRDLASEVRAGRVFADLSRLPERGPDWDPLLACRRLADKPRSHKRSRAAAVAA
ncbi:MAG: NAD(P)/FAD-dependent oxidoreductase [Actinomycetota bacterium]|nr:NAD(P)/FAD-dependent oxidoreductase [Actinomycetota bacterium]